MTGDFSIAADSVTSPSSRVSAAPSWASASR